MSDCKHLIVYRYDEDQWRCKQCRESFTQSSRLDKLQSAVDWVLNDAAYKPPELIGDIAERWVYRLRDAKEPT